MRYEIKVPINKLRQNIIVNWINSNPIKKVFPDREISSLYYDTSKLDCAKDNLYGISNRRKYRIRWYDLNHNKKFYEIKIKKSNLGFKIDQKITDNYGSLENIYSLEKLLHNSKNNFKFLNSIKHNNLKPVLKTRYLRSYYLCENIRITYDQNLNYTLLEQQIGSEKTLDDQFNVIEFKFDVANYYKASNIISKTSFLPKRFSKYLRGLYLHKYSSYF